MNYEETEIVADAGVRLRIIADGLLTAADVLEDEASEPMSEARTFRSFARHVDEVRVRLCALPLEAEGEAA